jgi:hypothetical protein
MMSGVRLLGVSRGFLLLAFGFIWCDPGSELKLEAGVGGGVGVGLGPSIPSGSETTNNKSTVQKKEIIGLTDNRATPMISEENKNKTEHSKHRLEDPERRSQSHTTRTSARRFR